MYKLNTIKQKILIISFSTLLVGCGGGSTATSTETTASTATSSSKAVQKGQVKDTVTGQGLENVEVSIGSHAATTDADGFYTLSDLTENAEVVINFEKEGYLLGSTKILIKELSGDNTPATNYLEYDMYSHDYQSDHDSNEEISSGAITIDASYIDTKGNPYNGTMAVKLTILDNGEEALITTFPGAFKGINTNGTLVQFETYGLISISLNDSNDNELSLADGETGTLIFNKVSSLEKPTILPLWYYNYDQGLWFEEGYAQLQDDGSYEGDISHLGTWSLSKPIERDPGIFRAHIIDENGSPMSDVRVHAIGVNWVSSDLSTDEDGQFEFEVIPGKSFQLAAYNYKDKYSAAYDVSMPAISSGDIVEE